jgi:hypothetical protein
LKILPGVLVVVGDTVGEAKRKRALLDSLVHPDSGVASLSIALGCDASGFELDGPLPEIPETNASKSGRERFVSLARRDNLTVRQLAQIAGSFGGLSFVGTAATIADQMGEWLLADGCDGFNVMSLMCPAASTISSTRSSRNCSGEACSAANMKARLCEKISVCRGPKTASSSERVERGRSMARLIGAR